MSYLFYGVFSQNRTVAECLLLILLVLILFTLIISVHVYVSGEIICRMFVCVSV